MGIFKRLLGEGGILPGGRKPQDESLLLMSLLLMAEADGSYDSEELLVVDTYLRTLPEFSGKDMGPMVKDMNKTLKKYKGKPLEAVSELEGVESEAIRKKCFVLAADIALSSGDIDRHEEELLEEMQKVLQISDEEATKILEVLQLKYLA